MKLATLKNGTRDGQLFVVSRYLLTAVAAPDSINTLQKAIDDWSNASTVLNELYQALNTGNIEGAIDFTETNCMSPLPRAYQWADGSAYVNHVGLVRKASDIRRRLTLLLSPPPGTCFGRSHFRDSRTIKA